MGFCQSDLQKNPILKNEKPFFECKLCYFTAANKRDFERHEKTKKHINRLTKLSIKKTPDDEKIYKCKHCDRTYKDNSGLWRHNQKCEILPIENSDNSDKNTNDELLLELIKQNKELQQILIDKTDDFQNTMIEQNNKIIELTNKPTIINNTTNNTNQQFNLNMFLNETCKDALNIMDVLNSLQLKVEDFEETGRLGYVDGISRIIINCIRDMDVEKRPMHCTDYKRETLYIKDENIWTKEGIDKNKFKNIVKRVAQMNLCQLPNWQKKYPESVKVNTKENDEYVKLSLAALGSRTNEEEEKFMNKIMKNVLKEVLLDKKNMIN